MNMLRAVAFGAGLMLIPGAIAEPTPLGELFCLALLGYGATGKFPHEFVMGK